MGYLGRAHPLVRRALERVRHRSLSAQDTGGQDVRVSVVAGDVAAPTLLYTFLARLMTAAGRALERVLAVQIEAGGQPVTFVEATDWLPLANPHRAQRTTDVRDRWFASWAGDSEGAARASAAEAFGPLAQEFRSSWGREIGQERAALDRWLADGARHLTGEPSQPARQLTFAEVGSQASGPDDVAGWAALTDPLARLQGFEADLSQPAARRAEAKTLLGLYQSRHEQLDRWLDFQDPDIHPLGLLMILPEQRHGA